MGMTKRPSDPSTGRRENRRRDVRSGIPVTHLITELDAGGAQTALARLLENMDRTRFTPSVICLYNGDKIAAERIRDLGVPVFDLGMKSVWSWNAVPRLYRILRRKRPRILHSWLFHADVLGRMVGRMARVPAIVSSRRSIVIGGRHRELIKRWTRTLDHKVIAACEAARRAEIENTRADPDKVVTIYGGLQPEEFDHVASDGVRREMGIPAEAAVVGTVGRLHPLKGHEHLLTALGQLRPDAPDVRALIVGSGELAGPLQRQAEEAGLRDRVIFCGQRADVRELLAALDVFVLPSLSEGLPNALLEAMASTLPVVATAVGGILELVVDGVTGRLVPPADAAAIARALREILAQPSRAQAMASAARQRVEERFSVDTTVRNVLAVYDELLRDRC